MLDTIQAVTDVRVERIWGEDQLPIADLIPVADAEGHGFVALTHDEWLSGLNRFQQEGEAFFVAYADGELAGMCGLNIDPFIARPDVGRIRHLYVAPKARRLGVGRALVESCIDHGRGSFRRLRLRTFDPVASAFYGAIGFEEVEERAATHAMSMS